MASVFKCEALKGGKRRDTLLRFHDGEFDLLFASDDVALGIDFPRVELVIHLEPPRNSEIFLARSSLAGNQGTAILIYSEKETEQTQEIQRKLWCNNIKTLSKADTYDSWRKGKQQDDTCSESDRSRGRPRW